MNTGQIINSPSNNRYTCISNEILQSKELTFEEKGLLVHLLSLPPDWVVYIKSLPTITGQSIKTIGRVFRMLQDKGYILSTKQLDGMGRFIGWNHIVYSEPTTPKGSVGTPKREHREADLPTSVITDLGKRESIQSTNDIQSTKNTYKGNDLIEISNEKELNNSFSMKELIGRALKLTPPKIDKLLEDFIIEQKAKGDFVRPLSDLRKHFVSWAKKQQQINDPKKPEIRI